MSKKSKNPFPEWLNRLSQSLSVKSDNPLAKYKGIIVAIFIGLVLLLYLIYSLLFLGRVYPQSYLGDAKLSGLKKASLAEEIKKITKESLEKPIELKYQEKKYQITPTEINLKINEQQTIKNIYQHARSKPYQKAFINQIKALFKRQHFELVFALDQNLWEEKISQITEDIDEKAQDASAKFVKEKLTITKEVIGSKINVQALQKEVEKQFANNQRSVVELKKEFDLPKVILGDREALEKQASTLANRSIILTLGENTRNLTEIEAKQLIAFEAGEKVQNSSKDGATQYLLTAKYTLEQTKSFLENLALTVDQKAVEPKLAIKDGALYVAQVSRKGRVIDIEPSAQALFEALQGPDNPINVALTFKEALPIINENKLDELGIVELIGKGETSIAGSSAARRANVANGVSILQSALLAPQEEFSTVKTLGEVSDKTGFLPELVIKDNKTTPEYGGGLCQVSTTLFRAVLNAGLKVTERRNHSFRVGYYEPPVGLDATIYLPKPDFRFVNDTNAHILIQGRLEKNRVIFELWGKSDGRISTVSEPIVSNITDPPPPIYVETDTLLKGETKQIEKPRQGAIAVVEYSVTRNGQVINKQTFRSVYKAGAARFLVGIREEPPAQITPAT